MAANVLKIKYVQDKVVLITGGAGGIGFAMVTSLMKNGVKGVAIVDISEEDGFKTVNEISSQFGANKIIFIKTDITKKDELQEAFEITVKTYSQLDIVINNAGIVNELEWHRTVAVNLVALIESTYLAMQKYLPKYKSNEEAVIVNTASLAGLTTSPIIPVYCSTKHGVVGFGKSFSGENFYNKYKVRVLTICPAWVETPLIKLDQKRNKCLFIDTAIQTMATVPIQSPDRIGEALIEIIENGKNGSIWVMEHDEPAYEVVVPRPKNMKVKNEKEF